MLETNKIGCIIMASGKSVRYGKNKLLEVFQGKTLLQKTLELTEGNLFQGRVVVTRNEEVANICEQQGVDVILHAMPGRNDTVRMGVERLKGMDGWMFVPCDQPLLSQNSIENMVCFSEIKEDTILRMRYKDKVGAPVYFGKIYYKELCGLPEKKGGSHLIKMYPEKVQYIEVKKEEELWDIDTPEDFMLLIERSRM